MERKRDPADIRYSRIAELYDAVDYISETFYFNKSRKQLLAKVQGKILEVGIGTGQSFKDYTPGQEIVGIERALTEVDGDFLCEECECSIQS